MGVMLKELYAKPAEESGFLGHQHLSILNMAQYWRSFEQLEAYARSKNAAHWPAWVAFNRPMKGARGVVGLWHETYIVRAGDYEAIYSGMPKTRLGKVSSLAPATGGREAARQRRAADNRDRPRALRIRSFKPNGGPRREGTQPISSRDRLAGFDEGGGDGRSTAVHDLRIGAGHAAGADGAPIASLKAAPTQ